MSQMPRMETFENIDCESDEDNYNNKIMQIENKFNNARGNKYFDDKRIKPRQ